MFDPYHKWLGIPPQYRPPTLYQLLGINADEEDREVIEEASIRQTRHLRNYQAGQHAKDCARLLTEVAQARLVLLNPTRRQAYDAKLAGSTIKKSSETSITQLVATGAAAPGENWATLTETAGPIATNAAEVPGERVPRSFRRQLIFGGAALAVLFLAIGALWIGSGKEKPDAAKGKPNAGGDPRVTARMTTPATQPATVFLADLKEEKSAVGYGQLGKKGDLGYVMPGSGETRILMQGKHVRNGLSMHARSGAPAFVLYRLGGKYHTFVTSAAIMKHPERPEGCVTPLTFVVLADGRELWKSSAMQKPDQPAECRVDVSGKDWLELRILCPGSHNNATSVWMDPFVQ